MKKRLLAVLLATAMATTMIVGCGNQNQSRYEDDEDEDDDDDDDEDDEDEDNEDEENAVEYDDMFEVSPDSILFGSEFDTRVLFGKYVVDGDDFYSEEYYKQFKDSVKGSLKVIDSYWNEEANVYAMPCQIEFGKFAEFWSNYYYKDSEGEYTCYNAEGRYSSGRPRQDDLRIDKQNLLNEYGADGITYYNNMIESYDLDMALIEFPSKDYNYSISISALVETEGNKIHFYYYEYNEDKTVTRLEEFYSCRFDFRGSYLEISKDDVVFELVPYEFRKSHYCQYIYNGPSL